MARLGQGGAMATVTHDAIYTEVRAYLLGLFLCSPETVIQGYQNGSPLPPNAVVMTVLFDVGLDVPVSHYDPITDTTVVQQSVEVTMQLDFYGEQAGTRARHVSNLWKSHYTATALTVCKPLYSKDPRRMPIVNEQAQYEDRWSVDVLLQYNPEFEHAQTFLVMPTLNNP